MDEGGGTRTSRPTPCLARQQRRGRSRRSSTTGRCVCCARRSVCSAGIKRDRDDEAVSWTTDEQERFYMGLSRLTRLTPCRTWSSPSQRHSKAFDHCCARAARRPPSEEEEVAAAAAWRAAAGRVMLLCGRRRIRCWQGELARAVEVRAAMRALGWRAVARAADRAALPTGALRNVTSSGSIQGNHDFIRTYICVFI